LKIGRSGAKFAPLLFWEREGITTELPEENRGSGESFACRGAFGKCKVPRSLHSGQQKALASGREDSLMHGWRRGQSMGKGNTEGLLEDTDEKVA
jgi:hypothetical protein